MATEPLTQPVRGPVAQPLIELRQAGVSYAAVPLGLRIDPSVGHGELVTLTVLPDRANLRRRASLACC
jgi:hypothetical protein